MRQFLKRQILRVIDKIAERAAERVKMDTLAAFEVYAERLVEWTTARVTHEMATAHEVLLQRLAQATSERALPGLTAAFEALVEDLAERALARVAERVACMTRAQALLAAGSERVPHEVFSSLDDDSWLWMNTEGARQNAALRAVLPGLPEERLQLEAVALKGDEAITHGLVVYRLFKGLIEKHAGPLAASTRLLDFGCGWGRVLRFFLKDVSPCNLWGIDAWDEMIAAARRLDRWCHYEQVDPLGPTAFPDGKFDCVYSHSVFSHLPEDVHARWLAELQRVLKPGGLLIATTRGRDFITDIEELRKHGAPPGADGLLREHYRALAQLYPSAEHALAAYDAGQYCFATCPDYGGVAGLPAYGEACIPRRYVEQHWAKQFTMLEYLDDRELCEQNVIVMRKPKESGLDGRAGKDGQVP